MVSALLLVLGGVYLFTDFFSFSSGSAYEIHVRDSSGQVSVKQFSEEGRFTLRSEDESFWNEYEIKDGTVNMLHSNCRDQLCVHMKKISKDGEMIVCLPHKVYLSVHKKRDASPEIGEEGENLDAVSE